MPVVFYASLSEFIASLPRSPKRTRAGGFTGYQSFEDAKKAVWTGTPNAVEKSEKILEKLESHSIVLMGPVWENDRVGMLPCVPSYLAGDPDSMRRLTEAPLETTPIRLVVDLCLSASFSQSDMLQRGIALLALARKLALMRPVELFFCANMRGEATDDTGKCAIPMVRLDSNPLDLTTLSYVLSHPGFLRQLCFGWAEQHGRFGEYSSNWGWGETPNQSTHARMRKVLRLNETDLLIDSVVLGTNPDVQWVNDQVKRYATTVQDYAC